MEWIFGEILENPKKFHPQQMPRVKVSIAAKNDSKISVQIADDGLTLSPTQLTKVWMPYYQGEKHFTGETSGMGLG